MWAREIPFVPSSTASLRRRHFAFQWCTHNRQALALALTANSGPSGNASTSWQLDDSALAAFPSSPPQPFPLSLIEPD